jgi:hypothetical protein
VNVEADSLNSAVLGPDVERGATRRRVRRDVARDMTQKTGQKCTATRRVFVPRAVADRVEEDLREELGRVKIGHPANDEVRMGPLATKQQLEDFRAGVAKLVAAGARIVHGGGDVAPIGVAPARASSWAPCSCAPMRPERPVPSTPTRSSVHAPRSALRLPEEAVALVARGEGGLVTTIYGDDRETVRALVFGISPHHGRVLVVSAKVADKTISPGLVLPSCVHGGPGRAGGGEELGGERGLRFYMQRTAVQGDRALLEAAAPGAARREDHHDDPRRAHRRARARRGASRSQARERDDRARSERRDGPREGARLRHREARRCAAQGPSRPTDSDPPPALTQMGVVVGTPQYMSPEQCRGQPLDGRSDLYTCGVLLYQLVTGQLPFNSESPFEVAGKQAFEPPPPPSTHLPSIDPELEGIILRTLSKPRLTGRSRPRS